MKKIMLVLAGLVIVGMQIARSQAQADISGTVIDQNTQVPVDFATVVLYNQADTTKVAASIFSDLAGKFSLKRVPAGTYILKISFMGYAPYRKPGIAFDAKKSLDIGKVFIQPTVFALRQVEVTAQRPDIELDADKTTFNINKDIAAASSNASEVLEKIPQVEMDIDGKPSVRGNDRVTVLIDNKPSRIYGNDIATVLRMIPATVIDKVEIITNPSAKYATAEGTTIINIITKKDRLIGINGTLSLSANTQFSSNNFLSLNIKRKRWTLLQNIGGNYGETRSTRTLDRITQRDTFFADFIQNSKAFNPRDGLSYQAGLSYDPNRYNSFTLSGRIGLNETRRNENTDNETKDKAEMTMESFRRNVTGNTKNVTGNVNFDYRRSFKTKDKDLSVTGFWTRGENNLNNIFNEYYKLNDSTSLQDHRSNTDNSSWNLQADFTLPLKKAPQKDSKEMEDLRERMRQMRGGAPGGGAPGGGGGMPGGMPGGGGHGGGFGGGMMGMFSNQNTIEMGVRADRQSNTNLYIAKYFDPLSRDYLNLDKLFNDFDQSQLVLAGYVMYNTSLKDFRIKAGLRAEQAFLHTTQRKLGISFDNPFTNLIPTLSISRRINMFDFLRFSYSQRVRRPDGDELNPFTDYSDPKNLSMGNPDLRPELNNIFEAGYSTFNMKTNWTASVTAFYRHNNNPIQRVRTLVPGSEGVSLTTFQNIGLDLSYGLEMNVSKSLFDRKFRASLSGNLTRAELYGGNLATSQILTYGARLGMFATLPNGFFAMWMTRFNGPRIIAQGEVQGTLISSISVRKEIWNKKGTIGLNFSDIFLGQRFITKIQGAGFVQNSEIVNNTRFVALNFTWNFGRLKDAGDNQDDKQDQDLRKERVY